MAQDPKFPFFEFPERTDLQKKLDAGGWGLFFIWAGVAWLMEIHLGVALLGVAVITLGGQLARWVLKVAVEPFWIVVGLCFAVGGTWSLLGTETSLIPILLIIAGGALLLSVLRRKRPEDHSAP
ncbi:MAG: hypothetical protein OER77_08245 [Myxococcales bacterium]|nr:hypothetical protein [Myxococcales bacterium]